MVAQSNGPFYAAGAGMVLAARHAERSVSMERREAFMADAAARLIATRPTNNNVGDAVRSAADGIDVTRDGFADRVEARVRADWLARRDALRRVGENAAGLIPDGASVLTHCWSEGALMETLAALRIAGKDVSLWCTETRPYLQGARLTAHSAAEMGIPATVITDGMVADAMRQEKVSIFMTAADRVTMSGHVINKVGTLTGAIAARHFGLPYYATVLRPDVTAATPADVRMEQRDGDEVMHCLGHRTASPPARGWYPAFDITPPDLITNIVTRDGVHAPDALAAHQPTYRQE
ncbi:hypothetical protein [Defluviimonas sp. SAOS-178_SWC]|uniref:hypothetical protein n=1 Tax=Defluviimonas sp. SAOS-178_SWC TaxID=3121287 RepID=UPI003221DBD1